MTVTRAPEMAAMKQERLQAQLAELPSLLVALSGGVDSSYLAWVAHEVLGQRALSVTAISASLPQSERHGVEAFVRRYGLRHEFVVTHELSNPLYAAHQPNRCYYCKDELFSRLDELARARG